MSNTKNIFSNIPENIPDEIFEKIISNDKMKIERIVSKGQSSPKDFWYDQGQNEWVLLLKGKAKLQFDHDETVVLREGDYINIPAHKKHRVEWTDPNEETIWLAIFY